MSQFKPFQSLPSDGWAMQAGPASAGQEWGVGHEPSLEGWPRREWAPPSDLCESFQVDISCLVDGELDEAAAVRAVAHIEACPHCRAFFEDTRLQVKLHLDMADPERLLSRYSALTGLDLAHEVESIELVERLTSVFYQLGKAYVLSAIDTDFRTRVFEPAVQVEATRTSGRGFIDGVVASGRGEVGGVDWAGARQMLNGRLSKIENALEKGTRLLEQTLEIDVDHEEARLYMAFVHAHEGRSLRAANDFKRIFDSAVSEVNRGHAAVQLARLYRSEGEYKKAILFQRWVTLSGLADAEERFFFVRFNIGVNYSHLGQHERALFWFRELLDHHADRVEEIRCFFEGAQRLRSTLETRPGFAEALLQRCPELFAGSDVEEESSESNDPEADDPGTRLQEPQA